MKPNSKNKTKDLNWPTSTYFTIAKLVEMNPKRLTASKSDITIRVRLTNEIEAGKVAEIGCIPGGKGRPLKVFAFTPITRIILEKAKADGIQPVDNAEKLFNVFNVSNTTSSAIVNPAAATKVS